MTINKPGDGGCQCGSIRYRLTGKPQMLYACHCRDCQKQSGSAFGMSLIMQSQHVEFIEGAESMRGWDTPGADGGIKRCHFCPNCGTRIMHGSNVPGQSVSIKAGSLDNTRHLQPTAHIWLQSAQAWLAIDRERYRCFETEPSDIALLANQQTPESDNG